MKTEKEIKVSNGYVVFGMFVVLLILMIMGFVNTKDPMYFSLTPVLILISMGFFIVYPNSSKVLVLFGAYKGTVKDNGFFWANPFYTKQKISLRARNFDSERVKVNDKIGNPILINVILVWKVKI